MATSREEAIVRLGLDSSGLKSGLNGAKGIMSGFAKSVSSEFTKVIATGAIIRGIEQVAEKVHQMKNQAENLDVGTDFFQGLRETAESVGPSADKAVAAVSKLSVALGQAKDGGKDQIAMFKKYGITIEEIRRLNVEEMFFRVADQIKAIPDPAKRTAAAMELMGKTGREMAGMLALGSEELSRMINTATKMSEQDMKEVEKSWQAIDEAKDRLFVSTGKALSLFGEFFRDLGRVTSGSYFQEMDEMAIQHLESIAKAEKQKAADMIASEQAIREEMDATSIAARHQLEAVEDAGKSARIEREYREKGFGKDSKELLQAKTILQKEKILNLQLSLNNSVLSEIDRAKILNNIEAERLKLMDLQDQRKKATLKIAASPMMQAYLENRARALDPTVMYSAREGFSQRAKSAFDRLTPAEKVIATEAIRKHTDEAANKSAKSLEEILNLFIEGKAKVEVTLPDP